MLRTVRVYGRLAKFLKRRKFEAAISSAAEAVRFLVANYPQLEEHMADQHYKVVVGDYELSEEELHDPTGNQEVKIIPVIVGAGGAVGRILIGAALIALSIFAGPAIGAIGANLAFSVGASLVLGGVAQLLSPAPIIPSGDDTQNDPRKSYSFSGVQQTSRAGVPVPIVYGEMLVGSVVISASIDVVST